MHIPDTMLQGNICPITAAISVIGVIAAARFAVKSREKPGIGQFGAIAALIFAGQMMNFPVMNGTSGHLLGGVLAAGLLGVPFGVMAVALVVAIQSLVFSDGGLTVLGANIFNMAILGAGVGGLSRIWLIGRWPGTMRRHTATALAAWMSVVLAALAVSIELAFDGQIALGTVLPAMLGVHVLIGLGEAIITATVCAAAPALNTTAARACGRTVIPLTAAGVVALLLSPLASGFPDGLEWVAEQYGFLRESAPAFTGLLPDYTVPVSTNEWISTGLAGLSGVMITFAAACLILRVLSCRAGARTGA